MEHDLMMDAHKINGTSPANTAHANERIQFINRTRGTVLAKFAEVAGTSARRTRGLLGRDGLAQDEGLWIVPCESVHTFGMRFAIDLVYLDREHRIRKIRHNVGPWRMSICLRAHSVIELAAGTVVQTHSRVGDQLELLRPSVVKNMPNEVGSVEAIQLRPQLVDGTRK
jgi:hypothetical protein